MATDSQPSGQTNEYREHFVHSLLGRQAELAETISKTLVSKVYENRYTLHPRRLREVAVEEVDVFFHFLSTNGADAALDHGRQRALEGLGEGPLLAICKILRQFSLAAARDFNHEVVEWALEVTEGYTEAYLGGYMTQRANQILEDQEQLRKALSTALDRQRQELHIKNHAIHTYIHGIMLTDLEGTITYVNPAFMKMWGYDHFDEVSETDISQFLGIENFDELLKSTNESAGRQKEFTAVRRNASTFDVVVSASLIQDEKLQPVGIMAFFIDVTERKQLETRLQRAQKMEAIGTLAGGVAHDLNNILSGLVNYPELMLLDLPDDSPLRQPISSMKESGQKAAAVVQDLLTLARRGAAVRDVLNLNNIVSKYLLSPEFEKLKDSYPDFRLETDLGPDLLNIQGSSVHLSKTVMNLVSNAAESMPNGGKIRIKSQNRYIDRPVRGYDHVEEGDYVVLSVSDAGVGIPSKDMERIFEPFYTKKIMGRSGSGLGMAVVWGTVKDHKGYIDVKSREGKGTTFTLYFPVSRRALAKDESSVSVEEYAAEGESILVVDDVEEQRHIATQILKRLGYVATSVSSGEEAVKYMENNGTDLVLLDMIMDPGIDGLETYKRILKLRPGQRAIIVSGYSETKRVKEALKLGAGAYVRKPYSLEKIGLAVRDELDRPPS